MLIKEKELGKIISLTETDTTIISVKQLVIMEVLLLTSIIKWWITIHPRKTISYLYLDVFNK